MAAADIAAGRLRPILGDWSPPIGGVHPYYPRLRLASVTLQAFVAHLWSAKVPD